MLKLKNLFENFDLAKEALSHWAHDAEGLEEMLAQFRVSSNAIYPFRRGGEVCFLRLAPVEEKREGNIRGELEFLSYLNANGYAAAEPIPADSGDTLLRLDTRWGETFACAFKKAPGTRVDRTDMSPAVMRACGRALGKLHALSRAYRPQTRMWSCFDALDWVQARLEAASAPQRVFAALAELRDRLASIPKTAENFGLVHYDFEPDNVFYDAGTDSCAAIDFEDAMYHFYALDIAKTLAALEEEASQGRFEEAREAMLEGYREEAPYTKETEALLPLMRRYQAVFAYARVVYCMAERPAIEPDWMKELCKKLEAFREELELSIIGECR